MADESAEHRDPPPGHSDQSSRNDARDEDARRSHRRRIIVTGLLTPPAVMTLGSRARAQTTPKSGPTKSQMASIH
jgi:hypothetical protein